MNKVIALPTLDFNGMIYLNHDDIIAVDTWFSIEDNYIITVILKNGHEEDIAKGFTKEEAREKALKLFEKGEWK